MTIISSLFYCLKWWMEPRYSALKFLIIFFMSFAIFFALIFELFFCLWAFLADASFF
jgi:hypothetical protein